MGCPLLRREGLGKDAHLINDFFCCTQECAPFAQEERHIYTVGDLNKALLTCRLGQT